MARTDPTAGITARLESGAASSPDLEQALALSQSSVSRALRQLIADGRVLRIGATRGARYALRRELRDIGSMWTLRQAGPDGRIVELGRLQALAADQYYLEISAQASERGFAWAGLTNGLPYFLQDQRPGGFLGRAVPRRYPELNLPQRVMDWTNEHYLRYLTTRGGDAVGDLILGDASLDNHLASLRQAAPIPGELRASHFPGLAREVMEGGLPGSSAHGEHPKFTALVADGATTRQILVKFSPPRDTATGQRWADLLVAEHLAHQALTAADIAAARSRVFEFGDRLYLETDRFDRHGAQGRIGVTSLFAIDTHFYAQLDNWIAAGTRLLRDRRIDAATLERIRLVSTFGALIANTDRHFGNLAFYDRYDGRFALAPVYDMLPMYFAPAHEQITARVFAPPDPTADTLGAWPRARELAENYWGTLGADTRVSSEFRDIARACLRTLTSLPRTGAYA